MRVKPVVAAVEPALLSVENVCIKLQCSKPVVYRLFENGFLDFVMQGRRRFVTHAMIQDYIARLTTMDKPKPSQATNNRWRKKGASVNVSKDETAELVHRVPVVPRGTTAKKKAR